jgi:inositol-phosphate phosphatase/L-galactose 1-phosphate phosphatase/histidinol-phosphatase
MHLFWGAPLLACKHSVDKFILFAHRLADASGEAIAPFLETAPDIEMKADNSPVSMADKQAEQVMREMIAAEFPEHATYGEEFGITLAQSGAKQHRYTWVLDPIDGTRAFIEGKKEWGTLIALCDEGVPVLGMLNQPATGERWLGVHGQPTIYQKSTARTRPCETLGEAEISTTSAMYFTPPQASRFIKLAQACRHVVRDGDCYAYGLLARGARDIVADAGLKPYDILALVPIIHGAGGVITTWEGKPVTLTDYANVIATGDTRLHEKALALLQGA